MKYIKKINEEHEKPDLKQTRVVLTEEDFTTLVSGGVVDKDGIKIILQDIGYDNMIDIISSLYKSGPFYDPLLDIPTDVF